MSNLCGLGVFEEGGFLVSGLIRGLFYPLAILLAVSMIYVAKYCCSGLVAL